MDAKKILIIQTAFIGDVILATSLIESLSTLPHCQIDILVRKGNESLLDGNPHLRSTLVWDKKEKKIPNLLKILAQIRREKYDEVINLQRFGSSGFLTAFSRAKRKSGFKKNPFSFLFHRKLPHQISSEGKQHEIDRNILLIQHLLGESAQALFPKLYPSQADFDFVERYKKPNYLVFAPGSVWFTKRMPEEKWVELCKKTNENHTIYFIGGPEDYDLSNKIITQSKRKNCIILCGRLSFLQSAALMKDAHACVVNDSAPLHIASAMQAQVTAAFCSTVPQFGFGPLGENAQVVEVKDKLDCRPCGLHGYKACPEGHFKCGHQIEINDILTSFGREN